MYKTISALKVRQNLGQIMNEVSLRGDDYIIERAGKPLVAMIPIEKYQSMQEEVDKFFESLDQLRTSVKKEDQNAMNGLIDEAVRSYRKAKTETRR
jgi:prevent-host-death family protein